MAPAERQFSNLAATPHKRLSVPSFLAVRTLFANPNALRLEQFIATYPRLANNQIMFGRSTRMGKFM